MITWLASYPRSGNSFFRIVLKHLYAIPTYEAYNLDLANPIFAGLAEIVGHKPNPATLEEMAQSGQHYIVKTHELPRDDYPAIYLVRDGRDAIVSHANYALRTEQELPPGE